MAHIDAVRLKAFKSVGGGWLEIRLDRGLNAVVGPNGCGKSSLLDALCFAFAAPLSSFGGIASLADLQNSDCNEVCEVQVDLRSGRDRHTVQAALTPDGSRAFKVNGRNKSGREVRAFLRALGIRLDSSAAVIKQAQVTRLADSNSPADLAALVAEASGLGRWNEEVAAASEEVKRTRKALAEVEAALLTMERGVAADEERLHALERLEQIDHEAASLAQQMAGMLQAALDVCRQQAAAGGAEREAAAARVQAAQGQVQRRQAELLAAQQRLEEAQQFCGGQAVPEASSGGGGLLVLQQQVAAAEEEVRLLVGRQQRQQELEVQLGQQQAAAQQAGAAHERAAAELAACQQAQRKVEADAQLAASAASAQTLLASLADEEQQLTAAVAAQEQAVAAAETAVEETSRCLLELQAEQQRLAASCQAAGCPSGGSSNHQQQQQQRASLHAQQKQQRACLQQLQQQEEQLRLEAGTLSARLHSSAGSSSSMPANAAWRPLHQCFSIREPQRCEQYATALHILAGKKLAVIVADSMEAAGQLLATAAGSGSRIWPLDSLVAHDHVQQQHQAARHFAQGQVVLPVDLLEFAPAHRAAIMRAFGGHVIAASDAVAEQLITRFGIPSVTPDGRVTSRGTLQGGWRGDGGSASQTPMHLKIALAAAEQRLAECQQQSAAVQAALAATQQELLELDQDQEAAELATAELAAAVKEVHACKLQLISHQAAQREAAAALARLRAELSAKRQLLSTVQGGGGNGGDSSGGGACSGVGARAALASEQQRLAAAAAALREAVAGRAAELADSRARLAAVEDEMALGQPDSWAEQLEVRRDELAAATSALLTRQADLAAQSAAVAGRQQEAQQAAGQLAAAQQTLAAAQAGIKELEAAAAALSGQQQELQQQLGGLLQEVPELAAVLPAAGTTAGLGPAEAAAGSGGANATDGDASSSGGGTAASVPALKQACARLAKQRGKLLEERRRSSAARLPPAEQQRFREQKAALAAAKQQAGTLQTAVQRLQEGIQGSSGQVLHTNEAVFSAISQTFQSLIAAVLPAYHVRLRKVGKQVHEGVQLEFAHRGGSSSSSSDGGGGGSSSSQPSQNGSGVGGSDGSSGGGASWRSGLDALSGGQRTMVSLTFVVAAAMAGAATSVLLMDEVDAALDETNQHLVARLFDALSNSGSGAAGGSSGAPNASAAAAAAAACSQVVCVSHNAAFQQLCSHVVKLTRGPRGTALAEGQACSNSNSDAGGGLGSSRSAAAVGAPAGKKKARQR